MDILLNQLHFQQPLWLLALIPLAFIWWLLIHTQPSDARAWAKVIDPNLLPLLLKGDTKNKNGSGLFGKWLLAIAWLIAIVALADPVWEKTPRPLFQTNTARVIILDLSNSMLINDLKPSRLARARFKIEDILSNNFAKKEEGQIGLVLFAGDAFVASPLTRDAETIRSLLEVLTPRIMPSQGSRADLGLQKAFELLTQAGVSGGQILLIADGISNQEKTLEIVKKIKANGHRISVLGVGTEKGGMLPSIRYNNGKKITVPLESENLQEIARLGGGKYHLVSSNNADLKQVLGSPIKSNNKAQKKDDLQGQDWQSTGPYILLLLLPLCALAFRKGWLFTLIIAFSLLGALQPQTVMAESVNSVVEENSWWDKLWQNKEQQAYQALQKERYDKVDKLSKSPLMRGAAKYKKGDFEGALKDYQATKGADARYNEGNALTQLDKLDEALSAYEEALKLQPDMADAKKNKVVVQQRLKQKKKKQQEQADKKNHKKSDSNKDEKNGKQKKEGKNKASSKSGKEGDKTQKNKQGEGEKSENKGENNKKNDQKNSGKGNDKVAKNKKDQKGKNQFSEANKKLDEDKKEKDKAKTKTEQEAEQEAEQETKKKSESKEGQQKDNSKQKPEETKGKMAGEKAGKIAKADELSKEEKMAAEQWLRRIPDDPGGLLRQKFLRQYKQRRRPANIKQPW